MNKDTCCEKCITISRIVPLEDEGIDACLDDNCPCHSKTEENKRLEKETIEALLPPKGLVDESLPTPERKPVFMGVNSTCNVCNLQYCICPERTENGDWTAPCRNTPDTWEDKIEDLACINYNMYLGSPAERADKITDEGERALWTYDEALNELKSFIRKTIEQERARIKKEIQEVIDGENVAEMSGQFKEGCIMGLRIAKACCSSALNPKEGK